MSYLFIYLFIYLLLLLLLLSLLLSLLLLLSELFGFLLILNLRRLANLLTGTRLLNGGALGSVSENPSGVWSCTSEEISSDENREVPTWGSTWLALNWCGTNAALVGLRKYDWDLGAMSMMMDD